MIRELSDLGDKKRKTPYDALKEEPLSIDLVIGEDGSFKDFFPLEKRETTAEAITAKKGKARLLLDKAEEVLGYGGEASNKKHQLFIEKLEKYKELQELKPVLKFYGQNKTNGLDRALAKFEESVPEKERKGNIAFRIKDKRVHEEANVHKMIIHNYTVDQKALRVKRKQKCSICGQDDYPVIDEPHGMIKRVPDGQSSGCALVSYNEDAFESYDLRGNNNSTICTHCARNYVEGLNWLLSTGPKAKSKKGKEYTAYTNRKNFGSDTAMVFWTRENKHVKEIDLLDAPDPQAVGHLIESVVSGSKKESRYIETDQFYSCTLSGSAARIAVRDWIETSLVDFRKGIVRWFQDIAIDYYDFDIKKNQTCYPRLYELARSCQRKKQNGMYDDEDVTFSRIATYLWNVALKNVAPPWWMLTAVLKRARLDKRGVTPERASLIKLILNRNNKGGGFMVQEKLVEGNKPAAYICGQIFAVLESIQRAALRKNINAGIRERYFTFALTSPSPAFGRLFNLSSKHFKKLKGEKPGLAVVLDKELQELCKGIKIEEFPSTFRLEEQGQFAIGYYHQKNNWKNDPKLKETVEEDENESDD